MAEKFDLIVVGGGPGGYVAAIRAAQLGMRAALVEREHLGGICLNWGCIPTKALLRSAEIFAQFRHAGDYGLAVAGASFDLGKIVGRSRQVASRLKAGVKHLLRKNEVAVIDGHARLAGAAALRVEQDGAGRELHAPHIILATGARARALPPVEPDGKLVWSYREAMTPDHMPASLLVVGSGAIGIEFACFYRALGADVSVVEVRERILPAEDAEISGFAHQAFARQGMRIHTSASLRALARKADGVIATLEADGRRFDIRAERVIAAVGVVGNVEDLGLEHTRVEVSKGHVVIDEWCRTGEPGVYAIGDLAGAPCLAHKASHEGILCVEKIAGVAGLHPLERRRIPACTYSRPQIASIGLTEAGAQDLGYRIDVGRFPFSGNGKAIALGEPEGFIKTVIDAATGELLGAHMIGAEVTELVQGFSIGMASEATSAELLHTVFPHPTLSEALHEATLAAHGRAIHC